MTSEPPKKPSTAQSPRLAVNERHWQWRLLKDRLATYCMSLGGISTIFAVVLIFFYLLFVVFPLFLPASIEPLSSYELSDPDESLFLELEEQHKIAMRVTRKGTLDFFTTEEGTLIQAESVPLPEGRRITSFASATPGTGLFALGLDDGSAVVVHHQYRIKYRDRGPGEKPERLTLPVVSYPLGETPIMIDPEAHPITRLAVQTDEESTTLVGGSSTGTISLVNLAQEESFLGGESEISIERATLKAWGHTTEQILIDPQQRLLYLLSENGQIAHYDIRDKTTPALKQTVQGTQPGIRLTAATFLSGGISLVLGGSDGSLSQWFPVRDKHNQYHLSRAREFSPIKGEVTALMPEQNRKGFAVASSEGDISIYHSTANRRLMTHRVSDQPVISGTFGPRADALALLDQNGKLIMLEVENPHPEVSWSALWGKVWYESYEEPDYIWQSSSASNDFEPKLSLTPLTFGTMKAMVYAMLMAIPLALLSAIFTAYFMAPRMRTYVKPVLEIMEALPTVILGFLAGLWLAPFIENKLPGIFAMLVIVPLAVVTASYLWYRLPTKLQRIIPDGWESAVLIPVVALAAWLAMALSQPMEALLFNGNLPLWLTQTMGIAFDQRNSVVVGLAMGFAVIPTIFSIAEDAVFSVPKHLSFGSLALGATRWQTLTRVVLLTASPGIFSALMIGMGRAVGETMIVLMATGNTPVMDMSIFQGMRTLSANIAVEMGEAEVLSTHYRVLFLAGLVLFAFTFVVNTLAELVRQRLRVRYSSL
ncbi:MAG: ABC transporter permease subunit [Gammaproteobacteria bacterium]|nr:ABC transporter permease subunit [Gammaproteobacteria bacterium]